MNFLDWIKSKLMRKNNLQLDEMCTNNCKGKKVHYEEAMRLYEKVKRELVDFSDYKKMFSDDIVKIGEEYFLEKNIIKREKLDDYTYINVVEDTENYEVKIVLKDREVCDLSCTCLTFEGNESNRNCKHIYAVLKDVCCFYNRNHLWGRCKAIVMDYSKKLMEIEKKIDKKCLSEENLKRYNESSGKIKLLLQKSKDVYENEGGEEEFLLLLKESLTVMGEGLDLLDELLELQEKKIRNYINEIKDYYKDNVNGKYYKNLMTFCNETRNKMLDISQYKNLFTNEIIEQGEEYSKKNIIIDVSKEEDYTYTVIVKDTEDYQIKIILKEGKVCELNCTCLSFLEGEKHQNCKHIYVALKTICDYYNREFISEKYQMKLKECLSKILEMYDNIKVEHLDKKDLKRYEYLDDKIDRLEQMIKSNINPQIAVEEVLNVMNDFFVVFGNILDELEDMLVSQEKAYKEKLSSEKYRKKLKKKYDKMLKKYKK